MRVNYVLATALVLAASFATVVAAETAVAAAAVQGGIMDSPGQRMPDGTVYAGVSLSTRTPTYTTQADAPGLYSWKKGAEYCSALESGGHRDWRVPTLLKVSHVAAAPLLSPPGASWPCCLRTARPSEGSRNPVRIPPFGTGRLRRSTTTVHGISASATGARITTSRTAAGLCGVFVK